MVFFLNRFISSTTFFSLTHQSWCATRKKKQQNFFLKLWYKTKNVLQKRLLNCSTTILRILCKPSAQYLSNSFFHHSFDRIKKTATKCVSYIVWCANKKWYMNKKNRNEHINRRKLLNKLVAACLQSSRNFLCYAFAIVVIKYGWFF